MSYKEIKRDSEVLFEIYHPSGVIFDVIALKGMNGRELKRYMEERGLAFDEEEYEDSEQVTLVRFTHYSIPVIVRTPLTEQTIGLYRTFAQRVVENLKKKVKKGRSR